MMNDLVRDKKEKRKTQGRRLCEDGGRDESDAATSQRTARKARKLPETGKGKGFSLGTFGDECGPADTLILASWPPEV